MPTSRRSGQRRDVPETGTKQCRDVGYQRRDVPETAKNQRRDVEISRCDVPESVKFNVATLQSHVATFQRRVKLTSRRYREGFKKICTLSSPCLRDSPHL